MKHIFIAAVVMFSQQSLAQNGTIFLDGRFDDWNSQPVRYADSIGDGSLIDITEISAANDEEYLYIRLRTSEEFKLTENNDLIIYIDTDNNTGTGEPVNGIGADLNFSFGRQRGTYAGYGFIKHNDIKLALLPTHTSDDYEIAIGRMSDKLEIIKNDTIRFVIKDESAGGDVFSDSGNAHYLFIDEVIDNEPIEIKKENPEAVRVMSYNILFSGLFKPEQAPYIRKILQAVEPEIITFNEFFGGSAGSVADSMNSILPIGGEGWYSAGLDGGNVTVSRYKIIENWLVYPGQRITASLIDLPEEKGKDILVINAHFRCCGADDIRQREADAVVNFILDAKTVGGVLTLEEDTPIILMGDLNLVGKAQQLITILTGQIVNRSLFGEGGDPDWDSTGLKDEAAFQTDARSTVTWKDDGSYFPPGKLDYIIYTDGVMDAVKSFVLNTGVISAERLAKYGLERSDSERASDHFPVTADMTIKNLVSVHEKNEEVFTFNLIGSYPNPFNAECIIKFTTGETGTVKLKLYDLLGNEAAAVDKVYNAGEHQIVINGSGLASGTYFYRIEFKGRQITGKMLLLK